MELVGKSRAWGGSSSSGALAGLVPGARAGTVTLIDLEDQGQGHRRRQPDWEHPRDQKRQRPWNRREGELGGLRLCFCMRGGLQGADATSQLPAPSHPSSVLGGMKKP